MKKSTSPFSLLVCGLCAAVLLSQCAKPQTIYNARGKPVATALRTPSAYVTTQYVGDATVVTRRLITRALTNADCGRVYEEVTVSSPRGVSVQERVIVRALPRLELENRTKS